MTRVVTALYDTLPQAELALAHLNSEVGVEEGDIVDRTVAGRTRLARVKLEPDERASCERQLEAGGYLLVARVDAGHDPDRIVRLLKDIPRDGLGKGNAAGGTAVGPSEGFRVEDPAAAQARAPAPAQAPPAPAQGRVGAFEGFRVEDPKAASVPAAPPPTAESSPERAEIAEERIPIVEEELRIGKREVLRGGARVHAHVAEHPVQQEIELLAEHVHIERRPATRKLTEEELEAGGLLRERVIEVSEMREEAVVSKEAFVREELIVKKTVERRTERIEETVRRTEVTAERLPGGEDRPAFAGFASAKPRENEGR
jgi:uncharacterized protein (TIGR02271 family)